MKGFQDLKRGFFAPSDLAVYAVLLIVTVGLFFGAYFIGRGDFTRGIGIEWNGERIYTHEYGKSGVIGTGYESRVEVAAEGETVAVTVYSDEAKKEYNVVVIDLKSRSAFVKDANCSFRKDCTAMKPVSEKGGIIVCVPHKIKVISLTEKEDYDFPVFGIFRDVDKYNRVLINTDSPVGNHLQNCPKERFCKKLSTFFPHGQQI